MMTTDYNKTLHKEPAPLILIFIPIVVYFCKYFYTLQQLKRT